MKKYIAEKEYRTSQFINVWEKGKSVIIEARNLKSAERKAESLCTVYTHYRILAEVKEA